MGELVGGSTRGYMGEVTSQKAVGNDCTVLTGAIILSLDCEHRKYGENI